MPLLSSAGLRSLQAKNTTKANCCATIEVYAVDRWSLLPVVQTTFGGTYVSSASAGWIGGARWIDRQFAKRHHLALSILRDFDVTKFYYRGITETSKIERREISTLAHFMYRHWDLWQPGAYVMLIDNRFTRLSGIEMPGGDPQKSLGVRPGVLFKVGRRDYNAFLYEGMDATLDVFRDFRVNGADSFWGVTLLGRGYWLPHPRLNLALRTIVEARNNEHAVDDLSYGGYGQVRSYPNGYLRGNYGVVLNGEMRVTVARRLWKTFFVQSAAFYDAAALGHGTLFSSWPERGHSLGVGIRAAAHQIVGVGGRLDVGRSLTRNEWRAGFGITQFF